MALDYVRLRNINEELVTIDRHLYLTADRSRVVEEGDPAGKSLWATPGLMVSRREAERLGASGPAPEPEPVPEVDQAGGAKQEAPPANKQRRRAADKAGGAAAGRPPEAGAST